MRKKKCFIWPQESTDEIYVLVYEENTTENSELKYNSKRKILIKFSFHLSHQTMNIVLENH